MGKIPRVASFILSISTKNEHHLVRLTCVKSNTTTPLPPPCFLHGVYRKRAHKERERQNREREKAWEGRGGPRDWPNKQGQNAHQRWGKLCTTIHTPGFATAVAARW